MPTSYTANIYENKPETFESFLLKCARQFGANIRMRDESFDTEIPEYKPETKYHEESLERAKESLVKLKAMSREEIEVLLEESYQNSLADYHRSAKNKQDMRARYEDMIQKIEDWVPPTEDHVNLKQFALEQLRGSLAFDCGHMPIEPTKTSIDEYISSRIEHYEHNVVYHTEQIQKEIESTDKSNAWNKALVDSLKSGK